jgi:hypothetical protein
VRRRINGLAAGAKGNENARALAMACQMRALMGCCACAATTLDHVILCYASFVAMLLGYTFQ